MSDFGHLTDEQLAAIAAQSSPANTGTSPPASLPPVDARANRDVTPSPAGGFDDAQGNNYFPAVAGRGLLADSKGNIYRQTVPDDFQHLSDQQLEELSNQLNPVGDALHSIGPGIAKGLAGIGGLAGDIHNLFGNAVMAGTGKMFGAPDSDYAPGGPLAPFDYSAADHVLTSGNINDAVQSVAGRYYEPQTAVGRGAETVGEMSSAALMPGSLGARAMRVLVPSAGAEAAGEGARAMFPGDPGAEALARGVGGLAGGFGQMGGEAIVNAPQRALSKALGGMTPDTLDNLTALLQSSRNLPGGGISLTPAEAGAQVGLPQLAKIQHFIENTPQGGDALGAFFTKRPGEVSATSKAMADMLAPARSDPAMLGVETQRAATGVQMSANSARLQAAKAAGYTAAAPEGVDGKALADMLEGIDAQIAGDKTGLLGSRVAKFRSDLTDPEGLAFTDVDSLSRVRSHWRDLIDVPPVGADPLTKEQAGVIGGHLSDLEGLLKSNTNYARGDAAFADASRNMVDPINAGPIGTMAGTTDVPTQTGALFKPANVGGANETVQAIQHLAGQDPSLPPQLVSQYLRNTSNDALANLQGGANEWGGARLGVRLGGTEERRAALLGGTQAAGGDAGQMADFLDALSATGKRLPVGSRTYFNEEMAKELGVPQGGFSSWTDPLTYGHMINNAVGGALYKNRVEGLAKFLMGDDPAAQRAFLERAQAMRGRQLGSALMLEGSQRP